MPVYNGAASVTSALESLSAQTMTELEIIVSDNASTDATLALCEAHAARDPRLRLVRQRSNIGAVPNFVAVLEAARGPFFMWAAADDLWQPAFIEANLRLLRGDPAVVASISRVRFMDSGRTADDVGTKPLLGSTKENLHAYLRWPGPNSRFYGLHRRDVLQRCIPKGSFLAWDWAVMAKSLTFGLHARVEECMLSRGARGESQNLAHVVRTHNRGFGRVVPLFGFTSAILADGRIPKTPRLIALLAKHNLAYILAVLRQRSSGSRMTLNDSPNRHPEEFD
jgi:glycosyltransferase involved in cell wall biosynthesis